jgi:hypothetical protein
MSRRFRPPIVLAHKEHNERLVRNTIEKLYAQNFKENNMVKDIFERVREEMKINMDNPDYKKFLEMMGQSEDANYKIIIHGREGFSYNPNHIEDNFKAYTFIPKSPGGNVVKVYDCKDNIISEYNVLKEISMQTYAHDNLAHLAGINVPRIVSFGRLSPETGPPTFSKNPLCD